MTPWPAAHQASLPITNSLSSQTHVHWVGDAIQPPHPVIPFSSRVQSFPASGSFQMSQLFTSGGQSIRVSAISSAFPMNIQDWFPLGWTGWISLQSMGLSRVFSNTTVQNINSSVLSFLYSPTLVSINDEKTIALTRRTSVGKVMSLLFNMLSTMVIAFLPQSKPLLISWLQSSSSGTLESKKIKFACFHFSHLQWSDGAWCHDLSFFNAEFQASFFTLLFHPHQEALWFLFTFCY